jgi:RsiW-degrading membrane proteinase PrsW (M82 family)
VDKLLNLLTIAAAPILICAVYIFIRDKYEKEPFRLLFLGLLFGIVITVPIIKTENWVMSFMPINTPMQEAFYSSFASAALVEEGFKYVVILFLILNQRAYNEPLDGIVYAVFISLGFAGLENILYVFNPQLGGFETGLLRAILAVPAHGWFGVAMGYHFALAKYGKGGFGNKAWHYSMAFAVPFLLHGFYDFFLLAGYEFMLVAYLLLVVYMWHDGLKKIKKHLRISPFRIIMEKDEL